MQVLHALAQVADHLRGDDPAPSHWWRVLAPMAHSLRLDNLARSWLSELQRAGIEYPGASRLIEALSPLQMLMDEARDRRAILN